MTGEAGELLDGQGARLDQFLLAHALEYRSLEGHASESPQTYISIHVPTTELEAEENERWYRDSVKEALETNRAIFDSLPPGVHFLFVTTSEQMNEYAGRPIKQKGDNVQGLGYPHVVFFTPPGLREETDAHIETTAAAAVQEGLKHEASHNVVYNAYGQDKARTIPGWVHEGIAMAVCTDTLEPDFSKSWIRGVYEALKSSPTQPPTPEYLQTTQIPGRKTTVQYGYGQHFLGWLMRNANPQGSPLEQKRTLKTFLDNGFMGEGFDLDAAMQKTYGMSYSDAYTRFMEYLRENFE